MTKMTIAAGACLAAALAVLAPAHAESNGNGIMRRNGSGHAPGFFHGAQAATRALLAVLHERLAITSAQEAAWQAFADAVVAQAADADAAAQAAAPANAVDALNLQASVLHKQADDASTVAQAFTTLYAQLTPAQRAVVDSYFHQGGGL